MGLLRASPSSVLGGGHLAAVLLGLSLACAVPARAEEVHLLIVVGLGGEPKTGDALHEQALALKTAAQKRLAVPAANITYLGERTDRDPEQISGTSTRENVLSALSTLAEKTRPGDAVWVVLFGHGSFQSGESRFGVPGPDLTAEDVKKLAARLDDRKLVFVNTASASGEFVAALSGKKTRVVVTATKSGMEKNETVFGQYFVQAFSEDVADSDKNGRISILEAFEYTKAEVARQYQKGNRLLTEHAVLEDGGGGALARTLFLDAGRSTATAEVASHDPRVLGLQKERRELEDRIESLKSRKDSLAPEAYEQELEKLLLELATKNEVIQKTLKGAK